MKIKTSELSGIQLEYAVAVAECDFSLPCDADRYNEHYFDNHYSWDWSLAGPIIERECIDIYCALKGKPESSDPAWQKANWRARAYRTLAQATYGTTPLEAAMRCYVASKLGDEVEIPEELI